MIEDIKQKKSIPYSFQIFLQEDNDIINNGVHFAHIEQLQKDFPTAAIMLVEKVPENWQNMSIVDGTLVVANELVLIQRAQKKDKNEAKKGIEALKKGLFDMDYKTSKYTDGDYTEEEWVVIKNERKLMRKKIEDFENVISS